MLVKVNDLEIKRIAKKVSIIFYVCIIVFFLLGADFPPPIGFLLLAIVLIVIARVVYRYSIWLTTKICIKENVTSKIIKYYLGFGSLLRFLACLVPSGEPSLNRDLTIFERFFLFVVVLGLTFVWGLFVYLINWWFVKEKNS